MYLRQLRRGCNSSADLVDSPLHLHECCSFRSLHVWVGPVPLEWHQWSTAEVAEAESQSRHHPAQRSHDKHRWSNQLIGHALTQYMLGATKVAPRHPIEHCFHISCHSQATTWGWTSARGPHRVRLDSRVHNSLLHPPTARFCKCCQDSDVFSLPTLTLLQC